MDTKYNFEITVKIMTLSIKIQKIRKNFVDNFVEKRRKTGFFKHKDQVVHNKQERQIKISTGKNAVFSGNFGKRMGKFRG